MSLHIRRWATLIGALVVSLVTSADELPAALPGSIATEYTRAHDLVDIGEGRKLNVYCVGQGKPTVVFDSGLSDWSSIWALVQPAVSERTRACTYDRAGMGYSDSAVRPSTPVAVVEDLHKLLRAGGIETPVVLVGHSLGGFNMKLYAALYPTDVVGLVLVDPSEDRGYARVHQRLEKLFPVPDVARFQLMEHTEMADTVANYAECVNAARAQDLNPTSALYARCTDPVRSPLGPEIAAERQVIQVRLAYQAAQASELANSVYGDQGPDEVYASLFSGRHPFGALPLVVLTRSIVDGADPSSNAIEYRAWLMLHDQTAALSSVGVQRVVPNTHHNIEIDSPQAIIDAVAEVLAKAQARAIDRKRGPL